MTSLLVALSGDMVYVNEAVSPGFISRSVLDNVMDSPTMGFMVTSHD